MKPFQTTLSIAGVAMVVIGVIFYLGTGKWSILIWGIFLYILSMVLELISKEKEE